MVLYFTSTAVDPPAKIYVGKDKYENEDLIKYGWEEDVWFHVDNLSSAHIYLRLPEGATWDAIPDALLEDLAQLTKANSIEGSKKNNICIIYTPWANLKKTGDMATGQVSFHKSKLVKRCYVEKKKNDIINRLNKTKQELYPDLREEREARDHAIRRAERKAIHDRALEEKQQKEAWKADKESRSYDALFDADNMRTNRAWENPEDAEDDFM